MLYQTVLNSSINFIIITFYYFHFIIYIIYCDIAPLDMKVCIFHFVKWPKHPFISKGTIYAWKLIVITI